MKAVRLCLVACFVVLLAACSVSHTWTLAGKWQKVDGNETIEFSKTGTTLTIVSGPTTTTVPYKSVDAKNIQIELGSLGNLVVGVAVANDTLTLTDTKGHATKYKKVK